MAFFGPFTLLLDVDVDGQDQNHVWMGSIGGGQR